MKQILTSIGTHWRWIHPWTSLFFNLETFEEEKILLKEGVKAGFVRSDLGCAAALGAHKGSYPGVRDKGKEGKKLKVSTKK